MESASTDAAAVEKDLHYAFMVFDADDNGLVITPAELARLLRGLGETATIAQWMFNVQARQVSGYSSPKQQTQERKDTPISKGLCCAQEFTLVN